MIFLDYTTTGDGTLSSLQFMKAYLASGRKVSELRDEIRIYPQALKNAKVQPKNKNLVLEDEEVKAEKDKLEEKMSGSGRVLIRPSGTEPLIRVMIEGEDPSEIDAYEKEMAAFIEKKFG